MNAVRAEIRSARERQGLTFDALSDRCSQLGFPLSRVVISKIESGFRPSITLPELLVLAAALGVPPLSLVLPVGKAERAEILPSRHFPIGLARQWAEGSKGLDWSELGFESDDEPIARLRRARLHDQYVDALADRAATVGDLSEAALERARSEHEEAERLKRDAFAELDAALAAGDTSKVIDGSAIEEAMHRAQAAITRIRRTRADVEYLRYVRRNMREAGDATPPLPPSLSWVDEAEVPDAS